MTHSSLVPGSATERGTQRYSARHAGTTHASHFHAWRDLNLASVGLGTYLGAEDDATDIAYCTALQQALRGGVNVVDTALCYRSQRSERAVGHALQSLLQAGVVARDEVLICSKAGYLAGDGAAPLDAHRYIDETYIACGLVSHDELAQRCHCVAPRFLMDQIERSRRNLGLQTIDVYYLHNPETQLAEVPRARFLQRMRAAFEALELAVTERKIGCYGIATWDGLRGVEGATTTLSLDELLSIAREVAGARHHFRALQLPFNLAMREAYALRNQAGRTVLQRAQAESMFVAASASILQGRLAALDLSFPDSGLDTSAQHALQLTRSTPGIHCALVGARRAEHVRELLGVAAVAKLSGQDAASLLDFSDE